MKVVAIIQARMGSQRLPGKVLRDLGGRPMLTQQILRLQRCESLDEIMIATTEETRDEPIAALAQSMKLRCFRGCESDVLARYWGAARESNADVIVRITADCPLIDPVVTDSVVYQLIDQPSGFDYASNVIQRTYPRGLDTEAFWRDTLERMYRSATSRPAREHVTWHLLREAPDLFTQRSIIDPSGQDASDLRWTVDTPEDLIMMKAIYRELNLGKTHVSYRDIVAFVRLRPWLSAINANIRQSA